jgi:hypothetical protein
MTLALPRSSGVHSAALLTWAGRPVDGGLLHGPHHPDPWADPGVLAYRDPDLLTAGDGPLSLEQFIALAYPRYAYHRWARVLIALLQAIADGELSRLIVTCPPRLGKSLLVSKLFPAYFIYRHPHLFAAIASYSGELAYAHSREARHFYRVTGNPLSKDSAAVGNWLTPERGGCIAAGVDGPFTGKGYSLGIIDDPYKGPADAGSARVRQRLVEWIKAVWFLRAEPQFIDAGQGALQRNLSAQVIVLTRWDHEDLIGWLLQEEAGDAPHSWHLLNLPAIAEHPADRQTFPPTCTVEPDWRRAGEALCPERFPLSELLKIRSRSGSYWWQALYQQRPSPATGSIFLRQWLRAPFPRSKPRRYAPLVLSCDLSFKGEEDSDHCGFVLMGLLAPELAQGGPHRGGLKAKASPQELEIEVLWAARHRFGLPETIRFLLSSLPLRQERSPLGLTHPPGPQARCGADRGRRQWPGGAADAAAQGAGPAADPGARQQDLPRPRRRAPAGGRPGSLPPPRQPAHRGAAALPERVQGSGRCLRARCALAGNPLLARPGHQA